MLCILRVSGAALDAGAVAAATGLEPYRIDPSCLHYEVANVKTGDWPAFVGEIARFLSKNEHALQQLDRIGAVTGKELDIAVFFPTGHVMKTLQLGTAILAQAIHLGLAIGVSIYSTETAS